MFVIGVDDTGETGFFNKKKAMRFIKPSRLPVMTVGKKLPEKDVFQHVLLPVDIERQAKEKALWAGYFSRFYQSTIHILSPKYKDSGLQKQVHDNIAPAGQQEIRYGREDDLVAEQDGQGKADDSAASGQPLRT